MGIRGWVAWTVGVACTLALCCGLVCVGGVMFVGGRYAPCVPGRPRGVTVEDLAGRYITAGDGELVLDASGRFSSQQITIEFDNQLRTLSGPGRWSLEPRNEGLGDIDLVFVEARFGSHLWISGTRKRPWLYWFVDDPDLCRIRRFERA